MIDFVLKEKKLAAINSFLLYSINCTIHSSDNNLHADLVSYSSFMEWEWDIYTWVGTCVCNLYQALLWPSPPPNFKRLDNTL